MKFNEYPYLDAPLDQTDTILVYDVSSGNIKQITQDNLAAKTIDGRRIFIQSTTPSDEESTIGDIWIDTT